MILETFQRPLPAVAPSQAVAGVPDLDLTFLLDRSGSMRKFENAVRRAYNRTLSEQTGVPGTVYFTPAFFGDGCTVGDTEDLAGSRGFALQHYEPRDRSTMLLDAIGDLIGVTRHRLLSANGRAVVLVIITDGRENASVRQTWDTVGAMIQERILAGWRFLLLGANQDAQGTAGKLRIPLDCAMTFAASSLGFSQAFRATSKNLVEYRTGTRKEVGYQAEQRAEQRRLLTGGSMT